jgi:UDP-N-acetylmuramoyl-tripeptide--D-alanyl-D-alanine ligase
MMCERPVATRLKYAFAVIAKMMDASFYYFTPDGVDAERRVIRGYSLEKGVWTEGTFPFPDAIYDRACRRGKLYGDVYQALADVPMTTDKPVGTGDKLEVYRLIEEGVRFADHVIPSAQVTRRSQVWQWADRYGEVIVKPVRGLQGRNLFYVRKTENGYVVTKDRGTEAMSKEQLNAWLTEIGVLRYRRYPYLVQPYIRSMTKAGNPFDIRAHLSKSAEGCWQIVRLYPRIGSASGVTSNLSTGGYITELQSLYELELGKKDFPAFKRKLTAFAMGFAPHLQDRLDYDIHEMALDLGLDPKGKLWLFEANLNRIGSNYVEMDVAKHAVAYTLYLASSKLSSQRNGRNAHVEAEKTS